MRHQIAYFTSRPFLVVASWGRRQWSQCAKRRSRSLSHSRLDQPAGGRDRMTSHERAYHAGAAPLKRSTMSDAIRVLGSVQRLFAQMLPRARGCAGHGARSGLIPVFGSPSGGWRFRPMCSGRASSAPATAGLLAVRRPTSARRRRRRPGALVSPRFSFAGAGLMGRLPLVPLGLRSRVGRRPRFAARPLRPARPRAAAFRSGSRVSPGAVRSCLSRAAVALRVASCPRVARFVASWGLRCVRFDRLALSPSHLALARSPRYRPLVSGSSAPLAAPSVLAPAPSRLSLLDYLPMPHPWACPGHPRS